MKNRYVFIGNTRGTYRPVVESLARSNLPMTIFGNGWDHLNGPSTEIKPKVNRIRALSLYRDSHAVINDHWPEMSANGFVSNRAIDALMIKRFVVSVTVYGIPKNLLPGFNTVEDLSRKYPNSSYKTLEVGHIGDIYTPEFVAKRLLREMRGIEKNS